MSDYGTAESIDNGLDLTELKSHMDWFVCMDHSVVCVCTSVSGYCTAS